MDLASSVAFRSYGRLEQAHLVSALLAALHSPLHEHENRGQPIMEEWPAALVWPAGSILGADFAPKRKLVRSFAYLVDVFSPRNVRLINYSGRWTDVVVAFA